MRTGVIFDAKRFAVHDGPGIRTTLFLKGCSLKCVWCHNPEGILPKPEMAYYAHKCIQCGECTRVCPTGAQSMNSGRHDFNSQLCIACGACESVCLGEAMKLYGRRVTVGEAITIALEDRIFYGETGGVTISGGEPLLQSGFVSELLQGLKEEDVHTAVDTCGMVGWSAFEAVRTYTDLFLYDIKHITTERHRALTGHGNEAILGNLKRLSELGHSIEVRMPLVPGSNDDNATLAGIGEFLGSLSITRMRILPYHSMARSKYVSMGMEDTMPRVKSPDDASLMRAVDIMTSFGVPAMSGRA